MTTKEPIVSSSIFSGPPCRSEGTNIKVEKNGIKYWVIASHV